MPLQILGIFGKFSSSHVFPPKVLIKQAAKSVQAFLPAQSDRRQQEKSQQQKSNKANKQRGLLLKNALSVQGRKRIFLKFICKFCLRIQNLHRS